MFVLHQMSLLLLNSFLRIAYISHIMNYRYMSYMEYHCALEPLIRALHRRVHAYDIPSDESVSRNSLYFIRGLQGTYSTDLMGLKEELSFNGAQLNEHVHAIIAKVCKQLPACANRKLGYSYVCYHDHDHDHLSNWLGSASQYSPGRQFPTHTLFTGTMP